MTIITMIPILQLVGFLALVVMCGGTWNALRLLSAVLYRWAHNGELWAEANRRRLVEHQMRALESKGQAIPPISLRGAK